MVAVVTTCIYGAGRSKAKTDFGSSHAGCKYSGSTSSSFDKAGLV